jgi:hypothetical protein
MFFAGYESSVWVPRKSTGLAICDHIIAASQWTEVIQEDCFQIGGGVRQNCVPDMRERAGQLIFEQAAKMDNWKHTTLR